MLRIHCPHCQEHREENEFHYAGQAHIVRPVDPDNTNDQTFGEYLYFRKNTQGLHPEMWVHATGCRKYFYAIRHTVTYDIVETYRVGEKATTLEIKK